jgi:hypothetical protein
VKERNSQATMTLVVEVMESLSWRVLFVTDNGPPAEPASLVEAVVEERNPAAIPALNSSAIPAPKHLRTGRPREVVAERH